MVPKVDKPIMALLAALAIGLGPSRQTLASTPSRCASSIIHVDRNDLPSTASAQYLHQQYGLVLDYKGSLAAPRFEGADGSIYIGWKASDAFAVKVPKAARMTRERLEAEAALATNAAAGGVLGIPPVWVDTEAHVLVTPYFPRNLRDHIMEFRVHDTRSADKTLTVLESLATTISGMHSNAVIHRDIKPRNIQLAEDGEPQLIDFGLAAYLGQTPVGIAENITTGTRHYMSPAQRTVGSRASKSDDMYAFGITSWELMHGESLLNQPEASVSVQSTEDRHRGLYPIASLATQNEQLPKYLEPISSLGMFRPDTASDALHYLAAARKVISAQQALELAKRSAPRRSLLLSLTPKGRNTVLAQRKRIAELADAVEQSIASFYSDPVVSAQIDRLLKLYPDTVHGSVELWSRLSLDQRRQVSCQAQQ